MLHSSQLPVTGCPWRLRGGIPLADNLAYRSTDGEGLYSHTRFPLLAGLVAEHRLDEDEAMDSLASLVNDQPRKVFKL